MRTKLKGLDMENRFSVGYARQRTKAALPFQNFSYQIFHHYA
ncbi:hypothetical protein HNP12_002639 [Aeromonas hydrophila]|nr:hypothetical protein [Aeromonas hydrophila]MCS3791553.1 hypothetical protein [Aeromonas hydrophila]